MLDLLKRVPFLQLALLLGALSMVGRSEPVSLGTWGDLDAGLAAVYLVPALALHAWSTASSADRTPARVAAWALAGAMCVHSGVLLQPLVLGPLLLVALADLVRYRARVPPQPARVRASPLALVGAGLVALLWLVLAGWLATRATPEAAWRLGASSAASAALAIAVILSPGFRAPARLLPALALHYLGFAALAAPALPFGPAVAWWVLCLSLLAGALVAARRVSGAEVPARLRRHEQVVHAQADPAVEGLARQFRSFVQGAPMRPDLAERLARVAGKPLPEGLERLPRDERERALRDLLGGSP